MPTRVQTTWPPTHTLYQFTDDWKVSDNKFRAIFGDRSTPLEAALEATLDWYRETSAAAAPQHA